MSGVGKKRGCVSNEPGGAVGRFVDVSRHMAIVTEMAIRQAVGNFEEYGGKCTQMLTCSKLTPCL